MHSLVKGRIKASVASWTLYKVKGSFSIIYFEPLIVPGLGTCVCVMAAACLPRTQQCCNEGCGEFKTKQYFIGHFPALLQSTQAGLCQSKAQIEFCSFFNSASCPGFNKAIRGVGRIARMLDVEGGGGGEGVKGANSSHRLVLVWDLISAMFYCHTHSPTCSIIVSKDVFKAKMSFCPKKKNFTSM